MLFGGNDRSAVFADKQLLFLPFYEIPAVKDGHLIDLVGQPDPFPCNAMLLALPAEYACSIITLDDAHFPFGVIPEGNDPGRTDIGTGFTSDTMGIIHNRFPPVVLRRGMGLCREPCGVGRTYQ